MIQLPIFVAKICVCLVSSTTVSTETSEESLSSATKSLVIGASARRKACGARTSVNTWRSLKPENSSSFELTDRHGLKRAAVYLAFIRRIVERQAEERRGKRRQSDHVRDAVVKNKELEQNRRAAHDLDISRQERLRERAAVDAAARNQHAEQNGKCHRQAREHDRNHGCLQERRQITQGGLPRGERRRHVRGAKTADRRHGLAGENARVELRLIVVPNAPFAENLLERAVAHGAAENLVDSVAQLGVSTPQARRRSGRRRRFAAG